MKSFFQKASGKMKGWLEDEEGLLGKAKEKIADKGISIPLTADMLMRVLQKQVNEHDRLHTLTVSFPKDIIRFEGTVKKFWLAIPFELDVKPVKAEKRTLFFEVVHMKPLNQEWIKNKVLNHPPLMIYQNRNMILSLNEIDQVRAVPIGYIQHVEIKKEKLWIKIGL
ncbi:hypothetical protein J2S09_005140 [Bacillus fengqiuensis]|nr:hypothetical protein [Bacillus fengqiuensis]